MCLCSLMHLCVLINDDDYYFAPATADQVLFLISCECLFVSRVRVRVRLGLVGLCLGLVWVMVRVLF